MQRWSLHCTDLNITNLTLIHNSPHTVHSMDRNWVSSRAWYGADILVMAPPLPVHPDHGAHLTVQEAVRQGDEESLEREKDIPCEDEDCLQWSLWLRWTHYGDQVGYSKKGHNDDQGLGSSQVDILCLMMITGPQLGDHNLGRSLECQMILRENNVLPPWSR